jgi:hypothetical protein
MNAGTRSIRAQAFWAWLTSRSGLALRVIVALCLGVVDTLWQLSPLSSNALIGNILFWITVGAIAILAGDWVVRTIKGLRGGVRVVQGPDLFRGTYLSRIVEIGREVMGDGHADEETLRARLAVCPDGIKVLVRRSHPREVREKVIGYLVCWTITSQAADRYLAGEYTSGLDLTESDFDVADPGAAYITMVHGADASAKFEILRVAADRLGSLFEKPPGPGLLLARPATPEGKRLMKRAGMRRLPLPDSELWQVGRAELIAAIRSGGL